VYLEETHKWTEPIKAEEEQRAEAQEEEPAEPKKKQNRKPPSTEEPRTKKPKGEGANAARRKQQEPPRQSTRESTIFSSRMSSWYATKEEKDPFYQFSTLLPILVGSALGWWKYRATGFHFRDHPWVYERPDTLGEIGGKYLEDFFYAEQDYCKRYKYKQTYGYLLAKY
jgi:hypothetical protein